MVPQENGERFHINELRLLFWQAMFSVIIIIDASYTGLRYRESTILVEQHVSIPAT